VNVRALDAAGIEDPRLRAAFEVCRRPPPHHGRTRHLATRLLPPAKRPYLWALDGFARYADRFGDSPADPPPQAPIERRREFPDTIAAGGTEAAVRLAMMHTMRRWQIPRAPVEAFLESRRRDLTVTRYATYADLERHLHGCAAMIGLQVLPILEPLAPEAAPRARALSEAFHLTTIIRDVGRDLRRDRIYLPQEDLEAFGVTEDALVRGTITAPIRELIRFEIERTRLLYAFAEPGIAMLHPTSRDGMRTAFTLYADILNAVEKSHYQVLSRRTVVSPTRRLRVVVPALRHARSVQRDENRWVGVECPAPSG
jgi:15-cis-phytoene synthase